ncbi:hypothetical protein [Roseateles terrae]|uniref:Uncharacterized protein n=1 Tax=Roseateles terrae TaxID=431060 RepID=A0ABR6GND3_9BURK|nr:hypothetical protein [Roseateles terrae]MBB3193616.1 hypothetical protein [Roseateles terrae]OWQ89221.1 hypothetical protein CDN98_01310 [Roseateles terrae]
MPANWPLPVVLSRQFALQALTIREEAAQLSAFIRWSNDPVVRMDEDLKTELTWTCDELKQGQALPGELDLPEGSDPRALWCRHPPSLCERHRLHIQADQQRLTGVIDRIASHGHSVLCELRQRTAAGVERVQSQLVGALADCEPQVFSHIEAFTASLDEAPAPTCADTLRILAPHARLRDLIRELDTTGGAIDTLQRLLEHPRAPGTSGPLEETLLTLKLSLVQGRWQNFDEAAARFRQLRGPLIPTSVPTHRPGNLPGSLSTDGPTALPAAAPDRDNEPDRSAPA